MISAVKPVVGVVARGTPVISAVNALGETALGETPFTAVPRTRIYVVASVLVVVYVPAVAPEISTQVVRSPRSGQRCH